jgi:hypothetical protein
MIWFAELPERERDALVVFHVVVLDEVVTVPDVYGLADQGVATDGYRVAPKFIRELVRFDQLAHGVCRRHRVALDEKVRSLGPPGLVFSLLKRGGDTQ